MSNISSDNFTQSTRFFQWIGTDKDYLDFVFNPTAEVHKQSSHNRLHEQNCGSWTVLCPESQLKWLQTKQHTSFFLYFTIHFCTLPTGWKNKQTKKNPKSFRKYSISWLRQTADNFCGALNQSHSETMSHEGCGLICLLIVLAVIYSEPEISFIPWGCRSTSKATPSATQPQGWSNFQWPVVTYTASYS